ncbi:RimJ/RimL family protein N-acetyltransferase [Thermocatellispora tengchongensis]|uniref:RimJ/RimL family protein N-acetyltransferase n=1 Tax=Thermocatellispora tengchongensis TaxID=1073253 RepID=A0A840P6Q7_9ACTN|nr:GNAT family N-acetyltransferase [Thermocatellispora tengchongensis]MBB5132907.1 RimJ/RimL family protein N-acetyltransferase [Thermocatellispora tengchongensis]
MSLRPDVKLPRLDESLLPELLECAVADADPLEVMPPVEGPGGWTGERRRAFLRFHRSRALAPEPVEDTYVILVTGRAAGAARLCPLDDARDAVEAGIWIGRSHRGQGVGTAVLRQLVGLARARGARRLFASTTAGNTPMREILAGLGATLTQTGDEVAAWVDLRP